MQYRYQFGEQVLDITIERDGQGFRAVFEGQSYPLEILDAQPGALSLRFEGRPLTVYWAAQGGQKWISLDGCTYRLEPPRPRGSRAASGAEMVGEAVRAPMPAQVREVQAAAGERVERGQTLLLLEAMKMEIRVRAPTGGTVKRLMVSVGQAVEKDQVLAEIEPQAGEEQA
jgi:acetyl/propionyl-CoA carboxylase alpha subunit